MLSSLTEKYRHKIKTVDELIQAVGRRPREKKVIMCHGVFDVVHPGHLRHLIYAKSKADVLVASITADIHISKGEFRPHVPQDLRALNLAAFEIVDYVIVDSEPTPLKNLARIQPDFFAKGYEYTSNGGLPPKTQEEAEVMRSFGGEIIFTPGDIVYSSSRLIEMAPPAIRTEKLLTFMDNEGLTFGSLREALDKLRGKRVHVVGDTIVDSYTQTAMVGGQTKTPTMSVLYEGQKDYIGGAAIVAEHLRAAGAEVVFSTVLGSDHFKDFVVEGLAKAGVICNPIIDATRPTTNKNAIVAGGYRLLKIDRLDNRSISDAILGEFCQRIATTPADAVVFSDFRHGIFNRRTIP
ncbi:MAG TPA: PfkB family carbohydrate kinase, partial [Burkholderiales bacterium]|nr:PfkB family carbohydrate kinase [Burkholderiales bacterium]